MWTGTCTRAHTHMHASTHTHTHTRAGLTDTRQLNHSPPSCGSFGEGTGRSRNLTRGLPRPATQSVVLEAGPEVWAPRGALRSADSQAHPRPAASFPEPGTQQGVLLGLLSWPLCRRKFAEDKRSGYTFTSVMRTGPPKELGWGLSPPALSREPA